MGVWAGKLNSVEEMKNLISKLGKSDVQRFKGLGEMNSDQLSDTTLDINSRTLIRIKLNEDKNELDQTFSLLMGNVVEPRRNFIIDNALSTDKIDI